MIYAIIERRGSYHITAAHCTTSFVPDGYHILYTGLCYDEARAISGWLNYFSECAQLAKRRLGL